ncbi:MAG: cache domain-containing protein [Campylobacteraceae bacterium]|nr:cache domain-containing protein [Campylobacteraceae bacterium]
MFKEKNLPTLIIYTPIIAVIFVTIFTIYLFVQNQNEYFLEESIRIEKEFNTKQKVLIKNQLNTIISYITTQEQLYTNAAIEKVIKRTVLLSTQLNQLYNDLNAEVNSSIQEDILSNLINSKISNDNYFFAFDISKNKLIQAKNKDIKREFKIDDKYFENYLFFEEGKLIQFEYSNKIVFIRYLPKLNWIIGNIENIQKDIDFIKKVSLSFISSIRFEKNGHFVVYDNKHVLLADAFRKDKIGQNQKDLSYNKEFPVQNIVHAALDSDLGSYVKSSWPKEKESNFSNKISYVQAFEKWNWILEAGLYVDDIQESILINKNKLEKRIKKYIQYVVIVSLLITFMIALLSVLMSRKIAQTFQDYQKNVQRKEEKLKMLNANLHRKVKIGIKEAQEKDRAMLHQSRLARLGTMISMIAHQWRQPLSEVSAILMEIETATKFKKLDEKLVLEGIKESDQLINYMSNTIDDFKNFFKPSKEKEDFLLDKACSNALSIVQASLNDYGIAIDISFDKKIIVNGYAREFSQVILNLLLNSRDVFEDKKVNDPRISLSTKQTDDYVYITVEDNAGGITEENINIIFEPYFTTKSSSKGTGLGLYMSKMIIEKNMNGQLSARNENNGAVFEIILRTKK